MIFGNDLQSAPVFFEPYMKEFKLGAIHDYLYTEIDNPVFKSNIFVPTKSSISVISTDELHERFFNKMYLINALKEKTNGYVTDLGIIDNFDNISIYNASLKYQQAYNIMSSVTSDIMMASKTSYVFSLQENEEFINNILSRKSADGVGKIILDNHPVYITPMMFPLNKSSIINATIYYLDNKDYFLVNFITTKKNIQVNTLMRFLYL